MISRIVAHCFVFLGSQFDCLDCAHAERIILVCTSPRFRHAATIQAWVRGHQVRRWFTPILQRYRDARTRREDFDRILDMCESDSNVPLVEQILVTQPWAVGAAKAAEEGGGAGSKAASSASPPTPPPLPTHSTVEIQRAYSSTPFCEDSQPSLFVSLSFFLSFCFLKLFFLGAVHM